MPWHQSRLLVHVQHQTFWTEQWKYVRRWGRRNLPHSYGPRHKPKTLWVNIFIQREARITFSFRQYIVRMEVCFACMIMYGTLYYFGERGSCSMTPLLGRFWRGAFPHSPKKPVGTQSTPDVVNTNHPTNTLRKAPQKTTLSKTEGGSRSHLTELGLTQLPTAEPSCSGWAKTGSLRPRPSDDRPRPLASLRNSEEGSSGEAPGGTSAKGRVIEGAGGYGCGCSCCCSSC